MDNSLGKDFSELYLYEIGSNILGKEKSKSFKPEVVQVIGLISCMGKMYARAAKIECDNVDLNFRDKIISFIKNGIIIDKLVITTEDIANPSVWIDNLYKKYNVSDI
jgi:hypothetical protein